MSMPLPPVLVLRDDLNTISADPAQATEGQAPDGAEPTPGEQAPPGGGFGSLLIPGLIIFAILWMLVLGPERRARKKQEEMRGSLSKGDEVMTNGGLFGRIVALEEDRVVLQIADGVRVKFLRQAIQGRVGEELEKPGGKAKGGDANEGGEKAKGA